MALHDAKENKYMKVQWKYVFSTVLVSCIGLAIAGLATGHIKLDFSGIFDPKYAVVWSGIFGATIAAVISLVGVFAANKSNFDRLKQQHAHDKNEAIAQRNHEAEQNNEDRKAAIRREVYIKVVEETHAVLGALGGLAERPLGEQEKDGAGLQSFLKENAKVWLVADSEAAHLSRNLNNLIAELYFKTLRAAYPLRVKREPIRILDRQVVTAESEIERTQQKISELKEQQADSGVIAATIKSWEDAHALLRAIKAERERQFGLFSPELLKHTTALFENMRPVQRVMVQLISALRKELQLAPDEEQFMLEMEDAERRVLAIFNPK